MRFASITISLLLASLCSSTYGQPLSCPPNIDFETGTYNNWEFFVGSCCPIVTSPSAQVNNRHELTSGNGVDIYGGFPVVAPGGGNYSMKLGNNATSARAEKVRYTIAVPPNINNYSLVYRYAVVLQDPKHLPSQQPRFDINVFDAATNTPLACNQLSYVASANLPGFQLSTLGVQVFYKDWTTATLNLSGLAGKTIIVDFSTGDCSLLGHFGYAYIDMSCGLFAVQVSACLGDPFISLSAPFGFQNYEWWDAGFTHIVASGQAVSIPTPASSQAYHVVLTPYTGYGCPDTLSTSVVLSDLAVDIGMPDTALCQGTLSKINAIATSSFPPVKYTWSPSTGLSCTTCPDPVLTVTSNNQYFLSVTDSVGCTRRDSFSVSVLPKLAVTATELQSTCRGFADGIAVGYLSSGNPPYTFSWNTVPPSYTDTISNLVAGDYVITAVDANGCRGTATASIKNFESFFDAGKDTSICLGKSTRLHASGGYDYSWSPTPNLSCINCASPETEIRQSTIFTLTGIGDPHDCPDTDRVTITVIPRVPTSVGADKEMCEDSSVTLDAYGGVSYLWKPDEHLVNNISQTPVVHPKVDTRYQVVVTQNECFKDTLFQNVFVYPNPLIDLGPDQKVLAGARVQLNAVSDAATIQWTPVSGLSCDDCFTPMTTIDKTITYHAVVISDKGCVTTDDLTFTTICDGEVIFMPNTFTPNADGNNDAFYPMSNGTSRVARFAVYSRWGELLFEANDFLTNDPAYGWDGTYKAKPLTPDAFAYVLDVRCRNGDSFTVKGAITLMR